ncbi:MAG: hypothetical protein ACD_20C00051G0007 [uncultured bacterium]|nr:MAG: hypothetical protein ACD_20C00051G0007 [uncultured bacterium]HBH19282.1 hypothetical protein [Cyanobacteria bacterium UBA9579]
MTNHKRWYDLDPTVSLAVSILRNASAKDQLLVADQIIEKSKAHNIPVEKILTEKPGILTRRWYDFEEDVFHALECLRVSPPEVQKVLAVEIVNYLCNLDNSITNDPV